jgi:hypothetical protein
MARNVKKKGRPELKVLFLVVFLSIMAMAPHFLTPIHPTQEQISFLK